jgi:hypothetical protein
MSNSQDFYYKLYHEEKQAREEAEKRCEQLEKELAARGWDKSL